MDMDLKKPIAVFLLFSLFSVCAHAENESTTEGGYIEHIEVNLRVTQVSFWHAVVGVVSTSPPANFSLNATPGGISSLNVSIGSNCAYGAEEYLLFSNSSENITSLSAGNLSVLDAMISRFWENGTATFKSSSSFSTAKWGNVSGVPTAYTNSPVPNTFRLGYLQDQNGNVVLITQVSRNSLAYNGATADFQLMLPTNGSTVEYYGTTDYICNPQPPQPPEQPGGGYTSGGYTGGGGGAVKPGEVIPLSCAGLGEQCLNDSDCCEGLCLGKVCAVPGPPKILSDILILAPDYVSVGDMVTMWFVNHSDDTPLVGIEIQVIGPDREMSRHITDENGEITFLADKEGTYAYRIVRYPGEYSIIATRQTETGGEEGEGEEGGFIPREIVMILQRSVKVESLLIFLLLVAIALLLLQLAARIREFFAKRRKPRSKKASRRNKKINTG